MTQAIAAKINPEDTEPERASLQWNDITALIMSRLATGTAPPRIMCQVETIMEKQAMGKQYLHRTECDMSEYNQSEQMA